MAGRIGGSPERGPDRHHRATRSAPRSRRFAERSAKPRPEANSPMAEGLDPVEVGRGIAEHRERTAGSHERRERWLSITEAVMLSVVAVLAAWSGFSAAKWS